MSIENECRLIYRQAFRDEDTEFEDALFENCFSSCRYLQVSGKVVSMLFALPCEILFDDEKRDAIYIYAAATAEEFRGKGYMQKLIDVLKKDSSDIIFLRPARKELIGFYSKLGFLQTTGINDSRGIPSVLPKSDFKRLLCEADKNEDGSSFVLMYTGINKIERLHFPYSME